MSTVIGDMGRCMEVVGAMQAAFSEKDEGYSIEVLKKELSLVLRVDARASSEHSF